MDLGLPVVRALVPKMELTAERDAFSRVPARLFAIMCAVLFNRVAFLLMTKLSFCGEESVNMLP